MRMVFMLVSPLICWRTVRVSDFGRPKLTFALSRLCVHSLRALNRREVSGKTCKPKLERVEVEASCVFRKVQRMMWRRLDLRADAFILDSGRQIACEYQHFGRYTDYGSGPIYCGKAVCVVVGYLAPASYCSVKRKICSS